MERQSEQPRRLLPLKEFVATVAASMSKVRRMIKKGRLEYAQPDGPGTDIYIPEDAFERLIVGTEQTQPVPTEEPIQTPTATKKTKTQPRRPGRICFRHCVAF